MTDSVLTAPAVRVRDWFDRRVGRRLESAAGGRERLRVVALLACVLGLSTADTGTSGAIAGELEPALGIGNTGIGLLVTASTVIGAVATLPLGVLADRVDRSRLLWISVLVWSAASIANGFATSFVMLLLTRLVLGAVVAVSGPVVASLTGDLFAPGERGRIWGYILTGELLGTGVGFLVSGLAADVSWRLAFWWLAVPGLLLAHALRRGLSEPARGGRGRLRPTGGNSGGSGQDDEGAVERQAEEEGVEPRQELVLRDDPTGRPLRWAVRYVLAIPTNRVLIVASALGYFFLQGLETFAVVFARGRFGLGQSTATVLLVLLALGAVVGVVVSGRVSDGLIGRRHVSARPLVAGIAFVASAALLAPGFLVPSLLLASPLFFFGAAALGGANPPLDAARLDIMHARLWGRAESVRTALRTAGQAAAPLLFGYVSTLFGGSGGGFGAASGSSAQGSAGLDRTFLIMLVPLALAGVLLLWRAVRTYPRDVATAVASSRATAQDEH